MTAAVVDKRVYPRKAIPASLYTFDAGIKSGDVINLSLSGMMVRFNNAGYQKKDVDFQLRLKREKIPIKGTIVWTRNGQTENGTDACYTGIQFKNLMVSSLKTIENALKVQEVKNIVILTLDSIYSNIAINKIVRAFPHKVSLICLSIPYSKTKGSFLSHTVRNLKNSGLIFTLYLGLYLYLHNFIIRIMQLFPKRNKGRLLTIRGLASQYNIPMVTTDNINGKKIEQLLNNKKADLIISIHLDQKIANNILDIPRYGAINLHYARLPEYRGPFPSFWAMLQHRTNVGASVHFMDEKFDEGDVIQQKDISVLPDDSVVSLESKIFDAGAELIIRIIRKIELDVLTSVRQDLLGHGTYYSYPKRNEMKQFLRNGRTLINLRHYFKALTREFS